MFNFLILLTVSFVGDLSIVSTRRGPGIPKLFIVRDLSLDSLRTSGFLPVGYILSLAQRATREENGTALFSTGKSHVRAGKILRLSAKKDRGWVRRGGRGELVLSGAESLSFEALRTRQDYSSFEVIPR